MPKARVWRSTGKAKKRTGGAVKQAGTLSSDAMPTKQRLEKGAFEIGGAGQHRIVRMLDAPLEQARAREQITETQFQVLARYRMHWFMGHHAGSLRGVDLDRIHNHDHHSGTMSEQSIWHREMLDTACDALKPLEREVTAKVVLEEHGITETGAELGYRSPYRGRQAVIECLVSSSQKITSAWLTMDRA